MINVTKTFLPPIEEYFHFVNRAFENFWLTNRGELALELENKLKEYLSINHILLMNNGTVPLQIALKILGKGGEIITTPFSYIATTSAILWESCSPVFVDIDEKYLTIDESKIEKAITNKTTCILATHVFGNPCNIEEIYRIASKYGLRVIYDAAHSFGVTYNGQSIFNYGDISTCSFHATKIFHTGEGGAVFCNDYELNESVFYSHNFGHNGPNDFSGLGINGKISELQCAMGLSVLPYMSSIIMNRKSVVDFYNENLNFDNLQKIQLRPNTKWNYSYYPIIMKSEIQLLKILEDLSKINIFPRRYFYPSLNKISFLKNENSCPISESISKRILCLPLFNGIANEILSIICHRINSSHSS